MNYGTSGMPFIDARFSWALKKKCPHVKILQKIGIRLESDRSIIIMTKLGDRNNIAKNGRHMKNMIKIECSSSSKERG